MNRPTISVVIAAYCGERFIAEQLRSLYRQTLPPDEILIGDDSDDDLTERTAAETFAESPCTVKWIKNPTRLGCPRNYANLAEKASGDLIFFCDHFEI